MAIRRELFSDPMVDNAKVTVEVVDGVVILKGATDNPLARDRAEGLAAVVKGVRSITNQIRVQPVTRPDTEIEKDIEQALAIDPAADSYEIRVSVEGQRVVLSGAVESWQERDMAEMLAKSTRGVGEVDNQIAVRSATARVDSEIQADVQSRLRWDALVDDGLVRITVDDGAVSLSGVVGSMAERQRAAADAWVSGVKSVSTDQLKVEWWAAEDDLRKNKYVTKDDTQIAKAIEDALLFDPRVSSFKVEPHVEAGSVTLTGVVRSLKAKRVAGDIAQNTTGVVSVDNDVLVATSTSVADTLLHGRIEAALLRHSLTSGLNVDAAVSDGIVTLAGEVDYFAQKAEAEDLVSTIDGVKQVKNDIEVKYPAVGFSFNQYAYPYYPHIGTWHYYAPLKPVRSDLDIAEDIREEIFWSPFVDADQVSVTVHNGVATLTGTVDTLRERLAAEENAFEGGAVIVKNQLQVDHGS